ncbi:restriction endonuclease [Lutimonas saemankumensis]|uniref:ATP cone domain-containing protein n=1 Tax=Lutimonas saemankumensis TaxID=483016 RepID=UPI001CD2BF16|nr:ATP cone domain-containing protein [Lutimonas saemankumensis]MCA0931907.1 restriction endonuclease [Lutimonas saemankumensis]
MKEPIKVRKFSGDLVDFDESKLIRSLKNARADDELAKTIVRQIENDLFDGMTTKAIYDKAFRLLKKKKRPSAARYKLKRAIMELGPSGFPFENYIGHIFRHDGYTTEVGIIMEGKCVSHEVDVLACKEEKCYIIECKYHNSQGKRNDIKIPLYIQSRYNDIKSQLQQDKTNGFTKFQGWIFTNTRFTMDAIRYAKCSGLQLVSWDYPENKSLKFRINKSRLFPITSLTSLTKREKQYFLGQGIVLCKEIYEAPELLRKNGFSKTRIRKIHEDIIDLCENHI